MTWAHVEIGFLAAAALTALVVWSVVEVTVRCVSRLRRRGSAAATQHESTQA